MIWLKRAGLLGPDSSNGFLTSTLKLAEFVVVKSDRVYPCHEIVKVDAYLPGCPPRAELFLEAIMAIKEGRSFEFQYKDFKYD